MLEFTILFGFVATFLLALYWKLTLDGQRRDELARQDKTLSADPYIKQVFRTIVFGLSLVSLFVALGSSMLGEPFMTEGVNNTFTNFTSLALDNLTNTLVTQEVPVVSNYSRVVTYSFTDGQAYYANRLFELFGYTALFFFIVLVASYILKQVVAAYSDYKKKWGG